MVFDYSTQFRTTCPVAVAGGFGRVQVLEPSVRLKIGCPESAEQRTEAVDQVFERGHMLYLAGSRQVLVTLFAAGRWQQLPEPTGPAGREPLFNPPEDLFVPTGRFGRLWREQPGLRDRLGWAVGAERAFTGAVQRYAGGGLMAWTGPEQGLLRIYYPDGTILTIPDPTRPVSEPSAE